MSQVTVEQALQLAVAHHSAGRLPEAESIYRQILAVQPQHPEALHLLGVLAGQTGHLDDALKFIRQAITVHPNNPAYHSNLGNFLQQRGYFDEALACFQKALTFLPHFAQAHYNLGNVWRDKKQYDQAIACYRRALDLDSNIAEIHYNLGNVLHLQGQLDDAVACFRRALTLKPNAETHSNLGNALKDKAQLDEATQHFRQALELNPHFTLAHDNLLNTLTFHPGSTPQTLFAEYQRWNQQHAQPFQRLLQAHSNTPNPHRSLRIGYLSPDLRNHPVGRFLLPLLSCHNRTGFQIVCYAHVPIPDATTEKLKSHADTWRDIVHLSDEQAAELIRKDQIDILVDLTLHMDGNRLPIFAMKPAPIQIAYLGHVGGAALDTIDYRLTDKYLDPEPAEDIYYMEKPFRLPGTYWCYEPPPAALGAGVQINDLPALAAGKITFGCLNNFSKVTAPTLDLWAALLQKIPPAKLLLHAPPGGHQAQLHKFFQAHGVAAERVEFVNKLSVDDYLRTYRKIDVALDPFPYNGGTTTCDALWMGVPVVTLKGRTPVGRGGVSLLSNLGFSELIGDTTDQYIQIALDLASDLPRLQKIRATLRDRMQNSPLMNAPQFARDIEDAYRTMWQTWCNSHKHRATAISSQK